MVDLSPFEIQPAMELLWVVGSSCNCNCWYCCEGASSTVDMPSIGVTADRVLAALRDCGGLIGKVLLTGGEPLLYEDLPRTIERLAAERSVHLSSNGLMPERLDSALGAGVSRVVFSIVDTDGSKPRLDCERLLHRSLSSAVRRVPTTLSSVILEQQSVSNGLRLAEKASVEHVRLARVMPLGRANQTPASLPGLSVYQDVWRMLSDRPAVDDQRVLLSDRIGSLFDEGALTRYIASGSYHGCPIGRVVLATDGKVVFLYPFRTAELGSLQNLAELAHRIRSRPESIFGSPVPQTALDCPKCRFFLKCTGGVRRVDAIPDPLCHADLISLTKESNVQRVTDTSTKPN